MEAEKKEAGTREKLTPVFTMLRAACKEYWQNISKFIEIYLRGLVGILPVIILSILSAFLARENLIPANWYLRLPFFLLLLAAGALAIYYGVRTRAAMILIIRDKYVSAKESFASSAQYFWSYLGLSLLATLIICAWSILLIIPGIIVGVFYLLFNYTFFFENLRGMKALRRSWELVKGYWWSVFGRLLYIGLIAAVINFFLVMPLGSMPESSPQAIAYNGFTNLVWALISPVIIIYIYYIFRDLLKIKSDSSLIK